MKRKSGKTKSVVKNTGKLMVTSTIVKFSQPELVTLLAVLSTQIRVKLNQDVVDEYAQAMKRGDKFPPLIVYEDSDCNRVLADGYHRAAAAIQADLKSFSVEIRKGSQWDALLYSFKANGTHGLRLSNADKWKAVTMVLSLPQCRNKSDNAIAKLCGVSGTFVGDVRKKLSSNEPEMAPTKREYERGGKKVIQNTVNIGKNSKRQKPSAVDAASVDDHGSNGAGARNCAAVSSIAVETATSDALVSQLEPENGSANDDFITMATAQVSPSTVEALIDNGIEIGSDSALEASPKEDAAPKQSEFLQMLAEKEFEYLFGSEDEGDEHQELLLFRFDGRHIERNRKHIRALYKKLGGSVQATKSISAELNDVGFFDLSRKEQLEDATDFQ